MAITVNWSTKLITIPQADLTFISGTLYELDTDAFRLVLKDLEDDEEGMPFLDTHRHNTEVTVAGTTFARTIEIINGYTVVFTPDSQWSVRLVGSNNNIFDVENGVLVQNQVQVIPGNSAGLIVSVQGSGVTAQDILDIAAAVWDSPVEGAEKAKETMRLVRSSVAGKLAGAATATITTRDAADTKDRLTVTTDEDGNRLAVSTDAT